MLYFYHILLLSADDIMNEDQAIKLLPTVPDNPVKMWGTLIELRKSQDMTQKELADMLEIDQSMMSFIENGKRKCPEHILHKLTEIFNVSVDYILQDMYTLETAKQIVNEQIAKIAKKGLDISKADRQFVLQVIRTLQPSVLVEEKVTQKIGVDGKMAYESARRKVEVFQEGRQKSGNE